MIICITGMPGSGKTIVSEYLKRKGFEIAEMGDVARKKMLAEGFKTDSAIREWATKQREIHGKDIFARWTVEHIKKTGKNVVLSGVRSVHEVEHFKKHLHDLSIVAIVSPKEERFGRLKTRGREDDPKEMAELEWRDEKEKKWGLQEVIDSAEHVIFNTGTLEELEKDVLQVLEKIEAIS